MNLLGAFEQFQINGMLKLLMLGVGVAARLSFKSTHVRSVCFALVSAWEMARQSWRRLGSDNPQCRSGWPRPSDVFANHQRSPNVHPQAPLGSKYSIHTAANKLAEAVCHLSLLFLDQHLRRLQTRRGLASATSSLTLRATDYSLQIATGQSEMHFYSLTLLSSG
jgi:hypothetical protein